MGVLIWSSKQSRRARRIGSRLGLNSKGVEDGRTLRLWLDGEEVETSVWKTSPTSLWTQFANKCRDAGWEAPAKTILLGVAGAACGGFVVAQVIFAKPILGALVSLTIVMVFWFYLSVMIARRRALFDRQLIDALDLAARSLRVGHPLVGSMRLVSEEVAAPMGPLFGNIVQQQELGMPMEEAIRMSAQSSNSEDLKLFATAVVIQLRSGGNLADMMERVASVMRDRLRLGRRIRVLTAQAQFSKVILLALPPFMLVLLYVVSPGYLDPLFTDPLGRKILIFAGVLLLIGVWTMNRLAKIRY